MSSSGLKQERALDAEYDQVVIGTFTFLNKYKCTWNDDDVFIFTDGACTGNGKNNPQAGWAAIIVGPAASANQKFGKALSAVAKKSPTEEEVDGVKYEATNNRAEGYAIIHALTHILTNARTAKTKYNYTIVSDSNLWITSMYKHLPEAFASGKRLGANRKNTDLCKAIIKLMIDISNVGVNVYVTHINSHLSAREVDEKYGRSGVDALIRKMIHYNAIADRMAAAVTANIDFVTDTKNNCEHYNGRCNC